MLGNVDNATESQANSLSTGDIAALDKAFLNHKGEYKKAIEKR